MTGNRRTWPTGRTVAVAALVGLTLGVGWLLVRGLRNAARRVSGGSMHPTLSDGQVVLTLPAWARELLPGRIVIVRDPRRPERQTVKRIDATAGGWATLPDGPGQVPRDHVAVRGDDPAASTDSRTFGPVPVDLVERHVVARLWPPRLWW